MNNRRNISDSSRNTYGNKGGLNSGEYNSTPANRFYTAKEEIKLRFYQVPKSLFNSPSYKSLSLGAKLMYSILRDRLDVSIKNEWEDENGYIYLIFTVDEIEEILEVTRKTAIKHKKELKNFGLIIDKRVGQGNPNRIYVLKPLLTEFQKCKNSTSRSVKKELQEVYNIHPIDTKVNHPNLNNVNRTSREGTVEKLQRGDKGKKDRKRRRY